MLARQAEQKTTASVRGTRGAGCRQDIYRKKRRVLPYMIAQSGPNQPLAGLSNQQAWALLLDDGVWEKACPNILAASGALRVIIRFYISIEDGECTVERPGRVS